MVVPPAVSVNTPSVSASSLMPSMISASVTAAMLPLVALAMSMA